MRRSRVTTLLAVLLPVVALIAAFAAFLWVGAGPDRIDGRPVRYVHSEANLRTCPRLDCPVTVTYRAGQQVLVVREVPGDRFQGSDTWFEIRYGAETRFVHPFALNPADGPLGLPVELLLTLLSAGAAVAVAFVPRLGRAVTRETDEAATDGLLFGVVAAAGIATGTAGFLLSRAGGESTVSFLAGTLVNLGAGLAGAAVAFVLFQSLPAKRTAGAREVAALSGEIERLRAEVLGQVGDLRADLARLGVPAEPATAPATTWLDRLLGRRRS
jgi:hypothetical protein